jgi:predicted amidohydrolase
MRLSVIQPEILWEDKSGNLSKLESMILPLFDKTDLVILPEMFSTGFTMNTVSLAERPEGETFSWMKGIAERGKLGICGSYIVRDNNHIYNRFVFVGPDSDSWYYDKRHLFSMGEEDKNFFPGNNRVVFRFREFRICPLICYDLRFPVWSRNRNDYDLIIYSANWPVARRNVWNILIRARAIENQCYVAASNRIGTDGMGIKYSGESALINPRGEEMVIAGTDTEKAVTTEISLDELIEFRKKFPVLKDSDSFTINH